LPGDATIISFGGMEYRQSSQVAFKSEIKETERPDMRDGMQKTASAKPRLEQTHFLVVDGNIHGVG
jgi:hypothetical protein